MGKKIDKSNMRKVIIESPSQFQKGLEAASKVKVLGKFDKVIICGMGGSALPGNILLSYIENPKIPFYLHRSYNLPPQADRNSLVFTISYSGNTEETISAYTTAVKKNIKTIAITTGGKLEELAKKDKTPIALIPSTHIQPREALGFLFSALIKSLMNSGIVEDRTNEILKLAKNLDPLRLERPGKRLAEKIKGKIPIIYASNKFKALSRIWKIKFNENTKIVAFWNYFPELNHNEMVGFTNVKFQIPSSKFQVIILRDKLDSPRILKRMRLTALILKKRGIGTKFINLQGKNKLEKIFNSLILSDWVSYYLALQYKIDPTPVKLVEEFKKRMRA